MTAARSVLIRPLTLAEYQALATGIPKNCPNAVFGVLGQQMTAAQAVTAIQTVLNAVAATSTAKTNWKDARLAEESIVAQDGPTVRGIRDNLATLFSNNTTALADLMITPRKPYKPLSAAARTAANAKAAATRAARGTKGKVQKAAITGDVTGVTITPVVSGSPATPSGTSTSAPVVATPAVPTPAASAPVASPTSAASAPAPSATPAASSTQKS